MSNPAFRFSLTAAKIEELLLSISSKLSADDIVYEYDAGGEEGKVSAASAVKELWTKVQEMTTGQGLADAIDAAPDSNLFTDDLKDRLSKINFKFTDSVVDTIARDLIDTSKYVGGEVILVQSNADGQAEFQYWKKTLHTGGDPTFAWVSVAAAQQVSQDVPTVGTSLLKRFPISLFRVVIFRVYVYQPSTGDWHTLEGKIGYKGTDMYYSLDNEVYTNPLFSLAYELTNVYMNLNITTLQANVQGIITVIETY